MPLAVAPIFVIASLVQCHALICLKNNLQHKRILHKSSPKIYALLHTYILYNSTQFNHLPGLLYLHSAM
jgi:hypothetical protein